MAKRRGGDGNSAWRRCGTNRPADNAIGIELRHLQHELAIHYDAGKDFRNTPT